MPSWESNIKQMFRPQDVAGMISKKVFTAPDSSSVATDLSKYDDVSNYADQILPCVQDGSMPPDDPWTMNHMDWITTFQDWIAAGKPEFDPVQSGFIVTNQDTFSTDAVNALGALQPSSQMCFMSSLTALRRKTWGQRPRPLDLRFRLLTRHLRLQAPAPVTCRSGILRRAMRT